MKQTVTVKFLRENMVGRFIIQVNEKEPDTTITEKNWSFIKEKRLSMVCWDLMQRFMYLQGMFYAHTEPMTPDALVDFINNYKSSLPEDKRFYRLITKKELEFVFNKFKEDNY